MKRYSHLKQKLFIISSLILLLYLFLGFRLYSVEGNSMKPMLNPGDRVLVSRWSYGFPRILHTGFFLPWKKAAINDIIVFHSPVEQSLSIKRCIGRDGDLLTLEHDIYYLNGVPLSPGRIPPAASLHDGIIAPDWIFLAGDNRPESIDSRFFGPVSMEYVLGKVVYIRKRHG